MALIYTSDSIGLGTRANLGVTDGESVFVGQEATLLSTDGTSTIRGTGNNQRVVIRGEVAGDGSSPVSLSGDNATVSISNTGSVTNLGDNLSSRAMFLDADNTSVVNDGTVTGNVGIYQFGQNSSLVNTGTITSMATTEIGTSMYAIRMLTTKPADPAKINTIDNHGALISNFFAIDAGDQSSGAFGNATTTHVTNTGNIEGDIRLGGFDDELHNSGFIDGEIHMGDDNDLYSGEFGTVKYGNKIYLGAGDDEALGGAGRERIYDGSGDDKVELGGGNDYVRAGGGSDRYDGGEGKDYISYYSSSNGIRIDLRDDEISGSWGSNDTIKDFESASGSKTGNDKMFGTNGSNTLQSYGGDDKLYGRGGNDKMVAGDGEDYLDGGDGKDLLWGGADADVFHFDHDEGHDVIKDFENNVDTIELDNFGLSKSQAFDRASESGGNVKFDFGDGDILIVENATIAQLQNDLDIV